MLTPTEHRYYQQHGPDLTQSPPTTNYDDGLSLCNGITQGVDSSSDFILSQRLNELVSEANRFRTKACGMNSHLDRSVERRRKSNPKVPGSSVTHESIDEQRR